MLFGLFGRKKEESKPLIKKGKTKSTRAKKTVRVSPDRNFGYILTKGDGRDRGSWFGTVYKVNKQGDTTEEVFTLSEKTKYMKNKTDMDGLQKYLVENGIMRSKDNLVDISDDADY